VEGSVRDLIKVLCRHFHRGTEESRKASVRIVGALAEIRTEHPQAGSQKRCRQTNPFDMLIFQSLTIGSSAFLVGLLLGPYVRRGPICNETLSQPIVESSIVSFTLCVRVSSLTTFSSLFVP
jgi:hypothetical protein